MEAGGWADKNGRYSLHHECNPLILQKKFIGQMAMHVVSIRMLSALLGAYQA